MDPLRWNALFLPASRSAVVRYGAAVLLAAGALGMAHTARELQDEADLSALAVAAIAFAAVYGGRGPALLCAGVAAVGIDYLFSEPRFQVFDTWGSALRVLVLGAVGYLVAELVAALRDAHHRLQREHAETQAAKRAREDVLAMVSHDLRSPLSAMLLAAEELNLGGPGAHGAASESILRSGRQMSRLIDDLLDAVKMEKGQFRILPGEHDVAALLEEAFQGVRASALAKGVRLRRVVPPGEYRLDCDGARVVQVLSNLLDNAVRFSPPGGTVDVRLMSTPDAVFAIVRDYGPGIAAESLPGLFSRYAQGRGPSQHGLGLGLYISRTIVEAHGGALEAASEPGRGAAFTVTLPRTAPAAVDLSRAA